MKYLIKGGTVIDPVAGTSRIADVIVENGLITFAGTLEGGIPSEGLEVIDAAGKLVSPGFIDLHVHLREPGREDKETIRTGTRAAAMGGFTSIAVMPNTNPVADNQAVIAFVKAKAAEEGCVRVLPIGSITKGQEGLEMAEMGDLVRAGAVGVSDDGRAVINAGLMRHVLEYSKIFGIPVMVHEEEASLAEGDMNEGTVSTMLGLRGISRLAEELMVARDILIAEETGARIHFCHLSTARSVQMVREAKAKGLNVTAEGTPHHFSLTEEAVCTWNTSTKVNPPLRTEEDREALCHGLADGTIDCIATDHAPHTQEEKDAEYAVAVNGMVGLETAVPLAYSMLVEAGHLDTVTMIRRFTTGPAAVLGLIPPRIEPGASADITIVDTAESRAVDPSAFESKGRNTPFTGMTLKGWPYCTMVAGKVVMMDRKLLV